MRDSPAFMLFGTADGPEIARRLLAMPDSIMLRDHLSLRGALRNEREAADYVAARVAALTAKRDREGRLPAHLSITLIHARLALRKAGAC